MTELSVEVMDEVNEIVHELNESVHKLAPEKAAEIFERNRFAHPMIYKAVSGNRGLASVYAGIAVRAMDQYIFSDQVDYQIRQEVLDTIHDGLLGNNNEKILRNLQEVHEYLSDFTE